MTKNGSKKQTDYASIAIPDLSSKPYPKWTWAERRAYLLTLIYNAGSSRLLSRTRLAEQFGKSISQITLDIQELDRYIAGNIKPNRAKSLVEVGFEKAHRKLLAEGKEVQAFNLTLKLAYFLKDIGVLEGNDTLDLSNGLTITIQRKGKSSDPGGDTDD